MAPTSTPSAARVPSPTSSSLPTLFKGDDGPDGHMQRSTIFGIIFGLACFIVLVLSFASIGKCHRAQLEDHGHVVPPPAVELQSREVSFNKDLAGAWIECADALPLPLHPVRVPELALPVAAVIGMSAPHTFPSRAVDSEFEHTRTEIKITTAFIPNNDMHMIRIPVYVVPPAAVTVAHTPNPQSQLPHRTEV